MIRDVCCYVKVFPRLPSRQICLRRDADICAVIPHGHAEAYVSDLRADAGVSRHHRDAGSPGRQDRHGLLRSVWAALRTDERHWNVLRLQPLAAALSQLPATGYVCRRVPDRSGRADDSLSLREPFVRAMVVDSGDFAVDAQRVMAAAPISSSTASSGIRSGRLGRSGRWRPDGADSRRGPSRRRGKRRCA